MRLDIPALSSGELNIYLDTTPVRTGAWIISWCALLIGVVISWGRFRRHHDTFEELESLSSDESRLVGVVLVAISLVIFLFNHPAFPLSLHARPGYTLENSTFIQSRTDTGLSLLAFRLENNQYRAGDTVELILYWQAQRFLPENYEARVRLVNNQDGSVWNQSDPHPPGNYPTRRWQTGLFVQDTYRVPLASDMRPGNYQVQIEVFVCKPDCEGSNPITFFNTNGQILGSDLTLPTLIMVSG